MRKILSNNIYMDVDLTVLKKLKNSLNFIINYLTSKKMTEEQNVNKIFPSYIKTCSNI